mgnify:CR=1 FL=1
MVSVTNAQGDRDPAGIFRQAVETGRPVLLVFSGSDWCLPCIRLQKMILHDSGFTRYAEQHLLLLIADFPQQKKLTERQVQWNGELAAEFNPEGIFPRLLLLKPDRSIVTLPDWEHYSPTLFIRQLQNAIQQAGMTKEYSRQEKLMGSAFEFIIEAAGDETGRQLLDACVNEVRRIEQKLTEFDEGSETALINRMAGMEPVTVSGETYALLQRCHDISVLTGGAFDISAGVLKKLYRFKKESTGLPDPASIRKQLSLAGYKKIKLLPGNRVLLEKPGMHIGFGAIGKGYAADKVRALMQQQGVPSGVINASGDLTAWGNRKDGQPWKTGIAHPAEPGTIIGWLHLGNRAIATSGDYEQFFMVNGTRYSHTIDPVTGYPARGISSVTVISPAAELSDALATAVSIKGVRRGLDMINQLPETHCIIVDDQDRVFYSKNIDFHAA